MVAQKYPPKSKKILKVHNYNVLYLQKLKKYIGFLKKEIKYFW